MVDYGSVRAKTAAVPPPIAGAAIEITRPVQAALDEFHHDMYEIATTLRRALARLRGDVEDSAEMLDHPGHIMGSTAVVRGRVDEVRNLVAEITSLI